MLRALCCLVLAVLPLAAQPPHLVNAKLQTRSAAAGLEKTFRSLVEGAAGPAWIGYAVAAIPGEHHMCCSNRGGACACALEGKGAGSQTVSSAPVKLEGPRRILVLFRAEQKAAGKIRMLSEDCALDAGGLPFWWLSDVRAAESVALLAGFVAGADESVRNAAVAAIAFHAGPEALDTLIAAARNDRNARVRGQALFWLAQRAGKKVASTITEAVENDPDIAVKKRAVFALSQLKEEGVPLLIQVARTNRNAEVRKQAVFWLGQSQDLRALAFFEEVLTARQQ